MHFLNDKWLTLTPEWRNRWFALNIYAFRAHWRPSTFLKFVLFSSKHDLFALVPREGFPVTGTTVESKPIECKERATNARAKTPEGTIKFTYIRKPISTYRFILYQHDAWKSNNNNMI